MSDRATKNVIMHLRYCWEPSYASGGLGTNCAHTTVTSQIIINLTLTQTIKRVLNLGPTILTLIPNLKQLQMKDIRRFSVRVMNS